MFKKDIMQLFDAKAHTKFDDEKLFQTFLLKLINLITSSLTGVFAILFLINNQFQNGIFYFIIFILLCLNLIYFNKFKRPEYPGYTHISLITLSIFYAVLFSVNHYSIVWVLVYPLVVRLSLDNNRIFNLTTSVFFVVVAILLLTPGLLHVTFNHSLAILLIYLGIYAFITIYDLVKNRRLNFLEKEMLDSKNESKSKDEFISKLSHQIRTPLNNIVVLSNIISTTKIDENQKDLIDTIIASTNNLVNVVNNIVKVSGLEVSDKKATSPVFNLHATLNNTIKLYTQQWKGVTDIHLRIDPALKTELIGDPIKIKQIFLNLIDNLIKYHRKEKSYIEVEVTLIRQEENISTILFELKVDTDPSLTLTNETLHEKNYDDNSIDATNEKLELDLFDFSIANKLISYFGGKLEVNTNPDNTILSFVISLRKAWMKSPDKPIKEPVFLPRKIIKDKVELKNANVLLVEDNQINQKIVVLSLKKEVKNIDVANNGKEALDKFGTSKYDVILMDIQMPVMDGMVATKKIREIEASTSSHTPIIAITANALSGDRENCLAAGMNEYISKPFQVEVLLQKMNSVLNEKSDVE